MQNKSNTWNDLVANWNHMDADLNNETKQIAELKIQLKGKNTSSIIEMTLEFVMAIALSSYIVYEILSGLPSARDYTLYSGILIIILISMFITITIKSKNLKDKAKSSFDYLNLLYTQSQRTQKILKISKMSCASLFVLCYGIISWVFILWLQSGNEFAKPIFALSLVAFVSLFFPSLYYWLKLQQTKTTKYQLQLQKMINEMNV